MGKVKRSKGAKLDVGKQEKNAPLSEQILEDKSVRLSGRAKKRHRQDEDEDIVDDKLTRRILEQARKQQAELEDEHGAACSSKKGPKKAKTFSLGARNDVSESDSEGDIEEDDDNLEYEDIEIDENDEKALEMFMSENPPVRRTLADIIMEKITEKQTEIQTEMTDNASVRFEPLDERLETHYKGIKDVLAKYRSGKLPKSFKIIPNLANWEQVLYITEPEQWSAAAMYQATRIFASNLNARMAQRFFNLVLYPRIRDDIAEYKRLNFHLYQAVKKSLFKPAAFFKGILLPLCKSGTCTLREAVIIASILAKCSIPVHHSAVAITQIAEMDYNGANSIFLKTLFDKKYALPYRTIDAVVHHFIGFRNDPRDLPVLWHQALLTFVQRYKQDVSSEQKSALIDLIRNKVHPGITPEIRRELVNSKCRDEETAEPRMDDMDF